MATQSTRIEYYGDTSKYERSVKHLRTVNKSLADDVRKTWLKVGAAIGGVFAVRQAFNFFTESAKLAGIQEEALVGLETVMKSMGRYSPEFFNQMVKTAQGLQKVTTFGDEATIAGQKFLMSYREIPDELMPRASAAMLDFAAMMKGDVAGAANALGKASMGMTGELRRIGITIDPIIAKSGDFSKILTEIERQVGGQARALAQTGIGPWKQLSNLWSDARENIGKLVLKITSGMVPALTRWVEKIDELANSFETHKISAHVDKITNSIERLVGLYDKLPAGTGTAAGYGIIGGLLFGVKGAAIGALLGFTSAKIDQFKKDHPELFDTNYGESRYPIGPSTPGFGGYSGAPKPDSYITVTPGARDTIAEDAKRIKDQMNVEIGLAEWTKEETDKILSESLLEKESAQQLSRERRLAGEQWLVDQELALWEMEASRFSNVWDNMSDTQQQTMINMVDNAKFAFAEFGKTNKAAFEVFKAISIAETIINTYKAAQGAYSAMASIPIVGPALGIAAAAAAIAAGMARVSAISSMSPGSTGGAPSGGGTYTSPMITTPATEIPAGAEQKGPSLVVHIHGDYFDSLESRQSLAEFLSEYVENYGGTLVASETI